MTVVADSKKTASRGAKGAAARPSRVEFAAAVNSHEVLETCLKRSPDVVAGARLRIYEGYPSASAAYNQALADSTAERLVLLHQDVYLPKGFLDRLNARLDELDRLDPDWAVAGVVGMDEAGAAYGRVWSSGLGRLTGADGGLPAPVDTMDEVLLVVRRASGIGFDPDLPSYHLYATDIVQIAKARGLKSYVIDAKIIHHSRPTLNLGDKGYRRAYRHMQRKWREVLPLPSLICPVEKTSFRLWARDLRMRIRARGRTVRPAPPGDPVEIARSLGLE
jgi:hypothetical protein